MQSYEVIVDLQGLRPKIVCRHVTHILVDKLTEGQLVILDDCPVSQRFALAQKPFFDDLLGLGAFALLLTIGQGNFSPRLS